MRTLEVQLGVPVYTALVTSELSEHLAQEVLPKVIQALVTFSPQKLLAIPGMAPKIIAAAVEGMQEAYIPAFRNIWIASACFAFVAVCGKLQRTLLLDSL